MHFWKGYIFKTVSLGFSIRPKMHCIFGEASLEFSISPKMLQKRHFLWHFWTGTHNL
jgi:hypothetical protein